MSKICLVALMLAVSIHAQSNPLFSKSPTGSSDSASLTKSSGITRPMMQNLKIMRPIIRYQKALRQVLSCKLRMLREGFSFKYSFLLLIISFAYGVIHALGPGHGKIIIGSYFLNQAHKLRSSIVSGLTFAATHTGMAVLIFLVFSVVLHATSAHEREYASKVIYRASGFLLVLFGVLLFVQAFLSARNHNLGHWHAKKSLPVVCILVGLVPCPASLLILIFTQALGILIYGVVSVIAIAAGMATTTSAVAAASITLSRSAVVGLGQKMWAKKAVVAMRMFGAVLIICVGIGMFLW